MVSFLSWDTPDESLFSSGLIAEYRTNIVKRKLGNR